MGCAIHDVHSEGLTAYITLETNSDYDTPSIQQGVKWDYWTIDDYIPDPRQHLVLHQFSHTYAAPGTYDVEVFASADDEWGTQSCDYYPVYVTVG
jgi:hypothetical protein